ncbi:(2Fe-2S)-binding protein [Gluconacetobacter diazotrophicus]|uniref:(2Fe-2S)-binding protein n=1 Tax=Gluconacetobacter diazotrophicus TaxID=33996 RepID=UPI0002F038C0
MAEAAEEGATRPGEIHARRGCRPKCGNCVPGMMCLLRRAIQARAQATLRDTAILDVTILDEGVAAA